MANATPFYPVYKCRLCGQTTLAGNGHKEKEVLDIVFATKRQLPPMVEFHQCSGPYAGSFGIADFLGYRKKG